MFRFLLNVSDKPINFSDTSFKHSVGVGNTDFVLTSIYTRSPVRRMVDSFVSSETLPLTPCVPRIYSLWQGWGDRFSERPNGNCKRTARHGIYTSDNRVHIAARISILGPRFFNHERAAGGHDWQDADGSIVRPPY